MKPPARFTRRKLLRRAFYASSICAIADGYWWEPEWLSVKTVRLSESPTHRILQFTDVHHKGDRAYLRRVIDRINSLEADLVCFTGDIMEDAAFLGEALEEFSRIKAPLYGVPGNHDYWASADFDLIQACFSSTGGRWLMDEQVVAGKGKISINGSTCSRWDRLEPARDHFNLLLIHYPDWVKKVSPNQYDLMLAGHSHGGQVRLPFYGAVLVPSGVGNFEMGLYQTPAGPLYVNPGIGCFYLNVRFCCRPELTVFEL